MIGYKGVVFPVQCDVMGHMNVQHYIGAFDQASWHLVIAIGYKPSWLKQKRLGWADRHYDVDFLQELPEGSAFEIESHITKVGRTSLTLHHAMRNSETGALCAEITIVTILFDLDARRPAPLPPEMLEGAKLHMTPTGDQ